MNPLRMRPVFGFGAQFSQLGRRLLTAYGIVYILELILEHWMQIPVVSYFQLFPLNSRAFHPWQILTHPFFHDPNAPIGFLVNCLVFYFFAAPLEQALGERRFLTLFYCAAAGGALCGLAFGAMSGFTAPFMGMMPSLLALIVTFGFLNPDATILLMFILPVKARYLSYGTILVTLLTFLARANPSGAYHLGGILFGYLYFVGPKRLLDPNLLYLKYLQWQMARKRSRFRVIEGKKGDKDDPPTIH